MKQHTRHPHLALAPMDSRRTSRASFRARRPEIERVRRCALEHNYNLHNTFARLRKDKRNALDDPYESINKILGEKPRLIKCHEIVDTYISHAIKNGLDEGQIATGAAYITKAYVFGLDKFDEAAKNGTCPEYRKDGKTPIFAHSARDAAMIAHLGASQKLISGLLLHDVIEDCNKPSKTLETDLAALRREGFDQTTMEYVALLTKPLLKEAGETLSWVFLVSSPDEWARMWARGENCYEDSRYEQRANLQFSEILNTRAPLIRPQVKVRAFGAKHIDGLENLVTEKSLASWKAGIRHGVIISQMRHLEVIDGELWGIERRLLEARGWGVPERAARWKPESCIVELPPPMGAGFNAAYLDKHPAPNGYFVIYSVGNSIAAKLLAGNNRDKIRVEMPSSLSLRQDELIGRVSAFFGEKAKSGHSFDFVRGESLGLSSSSGSGKVLWVSGIRSGKDYKEFMRVFELLHESRREVLGIRK